ncbi:hypothetical protein [Phyllobacterium lublinensis]|uniref:hypothetical protein n=1 Tax=Phyllobacterium lublinensis TaxID=2875708 RepID=UPI001CCD9B53|nr:hypothetical protein [Phyllobacterium sp. 2063]MBZ9656857.1 hypothetical protein [Phyllobacterium sp. 2063]
MKKIIISGLATLVIVAAALLSLPHTHASSPKFTWGINGHPLASYHGVSEEQQVTYIKELGLTSYRVDVQKLDQLEELDRLVTLAGNNGITILPVLTPALDLKEASTETIYATSRALAFVTASHLKDKIKVWELGNELENFAIIQPCEMRDNGTLYPCEWGPAGGLDPLDYYGPRWDKVRAVLRGLSDGLTAAGGDFRTAMGTAGWGHMGAFQRMKQDNINWDISVWHFYGEDPEWALKELVKFGKPIWFTEFNHPKGSTDGADAQAAGLRKAMERIQELRKTYPVEAAHIYELMDETYWAPSFEAYMGLVHLDSNDAGGWRPGAPKPAYDVVRDIVHGDQLAKGESQ